MPDDVSSREQHKPRSENQKNGRKRGVAFEGQFLPYDVCTCQSCGSGEPTRIQPVTHGASIEGCLALVGLAVLGRSAIGTATDPSRASA